MMELYHLREVPIRQISADFNANGQGIKTFTKFS